MDTVEVAILKVLSHEVNYGEDYAHIVSKMLDDSDWISLTQSELATIRSNQYEVAVAMGADSLIIVQRPTPEQRDMGLAKLKAVIAKLEAEKLKSIRRAEKLRKDREEKDAERKLAKAKRDLAKAQKILADAGVI